MGMKRHSQTETRSETLFRHTRQMLHDTRCSMETFAQRVVEAYHLATPPDARRIEFKTDGDVFRCATTNAQRLKRWMDDPIVNARIPVDMEEAWVAGLSEPYRLACVRDLAKRYGLIGAQMPELQQVSDVLAVSELAADFGRAIGAISPLLDDGRLDQRDAPHADEAINELEGLVACATGLIARLKAAQGIVIG